MLVLQYYSSLPKRQYDSVKKMLDKYDKSFIPALSSRKSTTQQSLFNRNDSHEEDESTDEYFNNLLEQSFILAIYDEEFVGFMSFIEDKVLPYGSNKPGNYVSTVIIDEQFRGQKLTKQFYYELMKFNKPITTRTWSTNNAHISILDYLNFNLIESIPNDRGENLDTVYYERVIRQSVS